MLTVGVDLAAESAQTALAVVDWDTHRGAAITEIVRGADDEVILAALARAGKAGASRTRIRKSTGRKADEVKGRAGGRWDVAAGPGGGGGAGVFGPAKPAPENGT